MVNVKKYIHHNQAIWKK